MAEEPREIGRFAFLLRVFRRPDSKLEYQVQSKNEKIPAEVVVMQLKAFLNSLEKEYFDTFERGNE